MRRMRTQLVERSRSHRGEVKIKPEIREEGQGSEDERLR